MKAFFKMVMNFLRKLPVAHMIKPVWKYALKEMVSKEIDFGAESLIEAVSKKGPDAVDKVIDGLQRRLKVGLILLPLPAGILSEVTGFLDHEIDSFQANLSIAVSSGGAVAIRPLAEAFRDAILTRIETL